jgi:hypothetical protein
MNHQNINASKVNAFPHDSVTDKPFTVGALLFNNMEEIWKDVIGYEGFYQVSNLGNIKSVNRIIYNKGSNCHNKLKSRLLKSCKCNNGYFVVNLSGKTKYVHRIVCESFIKIIKSGLTVNHKDGDKSNNNINNLEIVTYSENHIHAFKVLKRNPTCLGKFGINHICSKPVIQISLNGIIIKKYENARQAIGFNYKHISACCLGKQKIHKGYLWKFI